jgi:hypothetical protein
MQSQTQTWGSYCFTMSELAALHRSVFAQGFSNNQRQAAARALLRHDTHIDGTHYHTKTLGGLHPSYISFHSNSQELESGRALSPKELVEASLQDIFDAASKFLRFFLAQSDTL